MAEVFADSDDSEKDASSSSAAAEMSPLNSERPSDV